MDPKIERKLSALKEMAERGTENEAIVAAEKLQRLCLKYGIDSGELGESRNFCLDLLDAGRSLPVWKKILATAIANGCGAYCFTSRRSGQTLIRVSGLPYQQTLVATQYRYLVAIVDRLAKENASGRDRHDYRMGVVVRLWERLSAKPSPDKTQEGLVLLARSTAQAKEHAQSETGRIQSTSTRVRGSDAYLRGKRDGESLNTNSPLGNGYALPASR